MNHQDARQIDLSTTNLKTVEGLSFENLIESAHVIVGGNGQCMCGVFDGKAVTCGELLAERSADCAEAFKRIQERKALYESRG